MPEPDTIPATMHQQHIRKFEEKGESRPVAYKAFKEEISLLDKIMIRDGGERFVETINPVNFKTIV